MSPSKHNHNLHIDLPSQRRSEHLLRETLLKDTEATASPRRRTSVASRSSSRTRALESSGGLWGWFWRDNGELSSASASEEDSPYLPTPSSPLRTPAGFFDEERRGRGRTAHTNNKSRAVESLERLTSSTSPILGASSGPKSKLTVALETVPSVGDLRVLVAAHDALTSTPTTSSSTPSASFTSTTSSISSPVSNTSISPQPGLDHESEDPEPSSSPSPRDILLTPPPTPPAAFGLGLGFGYERPLAYPTPTTPPISRIPVLGSAQKHRRALSVSVFPQRTVSASASVSTPSTPKRSTIPVPTVAAAKSGTPKRTNSLIVSTANGNTKRPYTPTRTTGSAITPRIPLTPTPTRVHRRSSSTQVKLGTTTSDIPRKMLVVDGPGPGPGDVAVDQDQDQTVMLGTPPKKQSLGPTANVFMPGTPQSGKRTFGGLSEGFVGNDRYRSSSTMSSGSPRRNTSAASLPVSVNSPKSGGGDDSPRRARTSTTLAEMVVIAEGQRETGGGYRTPVRKNKAHLYSSEMEGERCPYTYRSPTTTTNTHGTTPDTPSSSQSRFNIRAASAQCQAQEGYVSFAAVEGLGEPESEVDVPPKEGEGGRKGGVRGWLGL
ncbi:hypothetical protein E1B28_000099 [Marasmius oreades]|nr:uncharacterized protein E1B28_000099 [Marasmius oreades]KAG7098127.1 hypothetical protein E1B28_000099 [Marasmius oreades]